MGRDHSIECVVCGSMRGGLDDLECACEQPYVALVHGLATLGHNLAIGGALCRAYWDGVRREFVHWAPGCGRSAP